MMKICCSHVIQMTKKGKYTSAALVIPHFDLVVITSRHKERLLIVKTDAPNRSFMLIELVNQGTNSIVPQLDQAAVEWRKDPWSFGVEG